MKRSHLIAAGAIAFVLAFIVQAPTAVLYRWFAPKESKVELYGLQGTLLQGSVAGIGMQGQPAWQELNWTLRPLGLITGRIVADIETTTPAAIRSRVSVAPWGTSLSGLRASGSVRSVLGAVGYSFLPIEGQVGADLKSLGLKDGKPSSADGSMTVDGLTFTYGNDPMVLGNYQAIVTTQEEQIVLSIQSVAGPLDVTGTAILAKDRAYTIDLRVKPKEGASPSLVREVQKRGKPDAEGYYHIEQKGSLA